jgi:hypothetical protein
LLKGIDGTTRVGFQGSRVIIAIAQFLRWAIWAAVYWVVIARGLTHGLI